MSNMTDYLENALVDAYFMNATLARPANYYLGLFTADPGEASGGTEASGGSYARQAIATGASSEWTNVGGGTVENTGTIEFPKATALWGTIGYAVLFDALTDGNRWIHGSFAVAKVIDNGDIFRVEPGDLQFVFA